MRTAAVDSAESSPVLAAGDRLRTTLKVLKDSLYDPAVQRDAPEDDVHYLSRLNERLERLDFEASYGYADPPSDPLMEDLQRVLGQLDAAVARFNALLATDVAAFNALAVAHHLPTLVAGEAVSVRAVR